MDARRQFSRGDVLFAEDFDRPAPPPEPEVIEPVFSADELNAAREAAFREGHAAGLHEASGSDAAAIRQAVASIAEQLAVERATGAVLVEQSAEEVTRLLMDGLAAVFPTLCARYGDAEVCAIVRMVLPALSQEPAITLRAHPRTMIAVTEEIARLEPELTSRLHAIECDAMAPGDVRILWRNGSAVRDGAALWRQVAGVLAPAGLLRADAATEEMIDGS